MRKFLIVFFAVFSSSLAYGQLAFQTGSDELDADLAIINSSGNANILSFKSDMTASFDVSYSKLDYMISMQMQPGDIYISLEIARITKRPVDEVIELFRIHRLKGWGRIAKEIGIKPGSPEFHALKGNTKNQGKKKYFKNQGKGRTSDKH